MTAHGVPVRAAASLVDVVVEDYRVFLAGERGLAAETVRCYCSQARAFLAGLPEPVESSLAGLSAGRVTGYVVEYCRGRNTWSAKAMVTALRSLLRYLYVSGRVVPCRYSCCGADLGFHVWVRLLAGTR